MGFKTLLSKMALVFAVMAAVGVGLVMTAFAQEPPAPPAPVDYWQKIFDLGMMFLITVLGPVITTFMKTAPSWVRYVITAVVSIGGGALTGEFTTVPFQADTLAMISGSISLALQRALHEKRPEPVKEADEAKDAVKYAG